MSLRMERVDSEVQKTLSKIINDDLRNPLLDDCVLTVCGVKTSPDFSQCKVFVSALNAKSDNEVIIEELTKSAGFIKKELAQTLNLKRTPNLVFFYDNSVEEGDRILKLIEKLNKK